MDNLARHTVTSFDDDLGELRATIGEMGALAVQAIRRALDALDRSDTALARQVVESDKAIDELERAVETLAVRTIALRAPVAHDLREVIAAIKIAAVIERIGDYAKNVAKRTQALATLSADLPLGRLQDMGAIVIDMTEAALRAVMERDAELARSVCERDVEVDDIYDELSAFPATQTLTGSKRVAELTHMLFMAKHIERIGDHATNVAEMAFYMAEGTHPPERRRGGADAG